MRLLLCTDLDGTLLPNGGATEVAGVRTVLARLVESVPLRLAYVTGRDPQRVRDAIRRWDLPPPDHVVADVGTSIFDADANGAWHENASWCARNRARWGGRDGDALRAVLEGIDALSPQEPDRQRPFKSSWYLPADASREALDRALGERLGRAGVSAERIFSLDPGTGRGLLDLVPEGAGKLGAVRHLRDSLGYGTDELVFGGDSGNDLDVLVSEVPAVLVANADAPTREAARDGARREGNAARLHLADGAAVSMRGLGLDGNYAGGLIEGLLHFHPAVLALVEAACADGPGPRREPAHGEDGPRPTA